jgi:GntR family transcriptional regulator, transcriptional repressor for pyruvate dehydrogenase complex
VTELRVPKASDVLADHLRQRILDGELSPGEMLPAERLLAEQSRLSRTAVREALRILEIEGLVATKPGRNGGTVVRRPDGDAVARSLDVFIRGRRVRFQSVLEAREQIEPICAELAAGRRSAAELERLQRVTEQVEALREDVPAFLSANVEWHLEVARASGNELLAAFMLALAKAVRAATDIDDFNSEAVRDAALKAHRRVLEAISAQDEAAARRAMHRHVRAYREQVLEADVPEELELEEGDGKR